MSYTPEAVTKQIPVGYFCFITVDIDRKYDAFLYWNQTGSIEPKQEYLMLEEIYYKTGISGGTKKVVLTENELQS